MPKLRPWLNILIKAVLLALIGWALYAQVLTQQALDDVLDAFWLSLRSGHWHWLLWVFLLLPLNWGLETKKWQWLMQPFLAISFWRAYQAILSGVAVSLFMPNRVGEYGGRLLMVPARYNAAAVLATVVGTISQWLTLLAGGWLAVWCYGDFYFPLLGGYPFLSLNMLLLALILLLAIAYFNIDLAAKLARRLPFPKGFRRRLSVLKALETYRKRLLLRALLAAALRYATFCVQYYCMLRFFGIDAPLGAALGGVALIFLLQTSIPLPPVMAIAVRGELALFFWSHFDANALAALSASLLLFIINLSLPALLGVVFIVRTNVVKSLGYED